MLDKIKNIMLQHKGKENAISSKEISKQLGIKENDTYAHTRQYILKCAKENLLPIASTHKGYYIIQTKDECMEYLNNLNNRAKAIQERKDLVILNFMD